MVLRQVMLQHLRAVLEEAARKTSTSQMRRVCREPKAEAPRSEEMRKDGERSVSGSAQREQQDGSQHDGRQARIQRVGEQNTPAHPRPAARGTEPRGSGRRRQRSVSLLITPQRRRSWQAARRTVPRNRRVGPQGGRGEAPPWGAFAAA